MQRINLELTFNDRQCHQKPVSVKVNGVTFVVGNEEFPEWMNVRDGRPMLRPFMEEIISELAQTGQARTSETYRAALGNFLMFREGADIALADLNSVVVKRYERHMLERGLSLNTVSFYMRILRAAYNRAVERDMIADRHPFAHVYTGISATIKRSVSLEAIRAVKNYGSDQYKRQLARDLFMFSFYTHGMSFVDMAFLRTDALHKGWLRYHRRKTGQAVHVRWQPCMQDIVKRYRPVEPFMLPIIMCEDGTEREQYRLVQNVVNYQLRMIAEELNLGCHLTMYVARHSWATIAQTMGTPIEVISGGMGHTNANTTRIYLRAPSQNSIDAVNYKIISAL